MHSLQSDWTIPHPLEPRYLGGLGLGCCALPSPPSKSALELGLEASPAALSVCSEELAAEGRSRSSEELRRCGHCVEDSRSMVKKIAQVVVVRSTQIRWLKARYPAS
jgi:hypothetical protein